MTGTIEEQGIVFAAAAMSKGNCIRPSVMQNDGAEDASVLHVSNTACIFQTAGERSPKKAA